MFINDHRATDDSIATFCFEPLKCPAKSLDSSDRGELLHAGGLPGPPRVPRAAGSCPGVLQLVPTNDLGENLGIQKIIHGNSRILKWRYCTDRTSRIFCSPNFWGQNLAKNLGYTSLKGGKLLNSWVAGGQDQRRLQAGRLPVFGLCYSQGPPSRASSCGTCAMNFEHQKQFHFL